MKPRLLIVGSGDIARRALPVLRHRYQVYACCRQLAQAQAWREAGARVLMLELDQLTGGTPEAKELVLG